MHFNGEEIKVMRSTLSVVRSAIVTGLILGVPFTATAQQLKYNLADPYGAHDISGRNITAWADEIRRTTQGNLQIVLHFNGSLFKFQDIKRAVQTGQAEFGTQLMQTLGTEKLLFEIDGLPFLAADYEQAEKLWQASRPYVARHLEKQGLRVLLAAPFPSQAFFYKKEVKSLADVKGMRQRAPNAMTSRLAQLMGAVPTSVQTPEIPQAMLTGTIQTFAISPTSAVDNKLWEVATHYYDANAWMPKQMLLMNEAAFQKLSPAFRKAVLDASHAAEKRGFTMAREENAKARATLNERGMKGGNPTPAFYGELKAVGEAMRVEWLQKADPDSKAAMTDYLKLIGK